MNTISSSKSAYLRFLKLICTVEGPPSLDEIDANDKALFESICLCWSEDKVMTVRDAISQVKLGSPATLHKRLHRLIANGLVVAKHIGSDKRTKYIIPSEKGEVYLEWLGIQILSVQAVLKEASSTDTFDLSK